MRTDYHFQMDWNDRLRTARDKRNVKNVDIARQCGVSDATVNGWMKGGIKSIEAKNLLAVARMLDVSPFYVIFGENAPVSAVDVPAGASVSANDILRLLALYAKSDEGGKKAIMGAAVAAASVSG